MAYVQDDLFTAINFKFHLIEAWEKFQDGRWTPKYGGEEALAAVPKESVAKERLWVLRAIKQLEEGGTEKELVAKQRLWFDGVIKHLEEGGTQQ